MNCSKCGGEVTQEACSCPECKAPMACENGTCQCECGAAVQEAECVCAECSTKEEAPVEVESV